MTHCCFTENLLSVSAGSPPTHPLQATGCSCRSPAYTLQSSPGLLVIKLLGLVQHTRDPLEAYPSFPSHTLLDRRAKLAPLPVPVSACSYNALDPLSHLANSCLLRSIHCTIPLYIVGGKFHNENCSKHLPQASTGNLQLLLTCCAVINLKINVNWRAQILLQIYRGLSDQSYKNSYGRK